MNRLPWIRSRAELSALVEELGFLPFFRSPIPGFSLAECTPAEYWFQKDVEGPWEWKGPAICAGPLLYGKLFCGKAGFVSRAWVPEFLNWRREGLAFDERYDEGASSYRDRRVMETLAEHPGGLLSRDLKRLCGYDGENKGFDGVMARLQMQTYVCVSNFEYDLDRHGRPYGWGVARYATPEELFGPEITAVTEERDPEDSRDRMFGHLKRLFPEADDRQIHKLLKGG